MVNRKKTEKKLAEMRAYRLPDVNDAIGRSCYSKGNKDEMYRIMNHTDPKDLYRDFWQAEYGIRKILLDILYRL